MRGRVAEALFLVPADVASAPWRLLVAPVTMLVSHDAVQFSYVAMLVAAAMPWFEWREGWRRTVLVFAGGGLVGALAGGALVLAPLAALAPEHPVVALAWTRFYSGASTGAFALLGGAGALLAGWRRWAFLWGVVAWELGIWAFYYRFGELVPVFHYSALLAGFLVVRSRWYGRVR